MKTKGKTMAVISGKGGVGKSNITLNFALSLIQEGKKVLVIDLDIGMGNLHILLGENSKKTIVDFLEGDADINNIINHNKMGLSFIFGGSGLHSILEWSEATFARFQHGIKELLKRYDYILFDMGAGATKDVIHLLLPMDYLLVVTTPEPTSITDAYSLLKFLCGNGNPQKTFLICNRAQSEKEGSSTLSRFKLAVERFLQHEMTALGTVVEDLAVRNSVIEQVPFMIRYPNSKASKSVGRITHHFLADFQEQTGQTKPSQFLTRLQSLFFERQGR
ncbi:MinD/ParA family protein [Bacillus coahuilensis]|uniref:MinD/ParA family protein n=1 Tax=Bacillus coahuilensis TaxID=408580 RepID=UPI0001850C98|nr:MinD/ParA family protein [Bacillus coahuilensis]